MHRLYPRLYFRLYAGFIFFVQVFFSYPTFKYTLGFPPLSFAIKYLGLNELNRWLLSNVSSWLVSSLIAIYCITKYQIADKIDHQNPGLNWLGLGCVIIFTTPILYVAFNRIVPTAVNISDPLLYISGNIIAPVLLLIGFIKVMSSHNQATPS